jgi:hypothetical protein
VRLTSFCSYVLLFATAALPLTAGTCPAPGTKTFTGCYYSSDTPGGSPAYVRTDGAIAFRWASDWPNPSLSTPFSVRWQGRYSFSADTLFTVVSSHGVRLYVDGETVLAGDGEGTPRTFTQHTDVSVGTHLVTVEVYNQTETAEIRVSWPADTTVADSASRSPDLTALTTAVGLATATVAISRCSDISTSGTYTLSDDLKASANSSCLRIRNASDIVLDCRGHSVTIDRSTDSGGDSALLVSNVTGYTVTGCTFVALNTNQTASLATVRIEYSARGTINNNTVSGGWVSIANSNDVALLHNVSNSPFEVSGNNERIEYNTITLNRPELFAAVLLLSDSTGSVVQFNAFDGGWDGAYRQTWQSQTGADDGIALQNVTNSTIQNNTILNTWGCGIENVRPLVNVQLLNNQIGTSGYCGIGGWYGNSLRGNTISGNTVVDTPRLFQYMRADGLYTAFGEQQVYFSGNIFSRNKLVRPRVHVFTVGCSRIDFQNVPAGIPASAVVVGNNSIKENDFGPFGNSLWLYPGTAFVDGGGNICRPDGSNGAFPVKCTPPTAVSGGYYALNAYPVTPSVAAPGAPVQVIYGANPATETDLVALAAVGSADDKVSGGQTISGIVSNVLTFTAPSVPGRYEFRYYAAGAKKPAAVSNAITVGTVAAITSFSAAPGVITAGENATLNWQITGSCTVTLDGGIGDVTGRTYVTVTPARTTAFTLSANCSGTALSSSVTVTVKPPADMLAPSTPTLLEATVSGLGQVRLSWTASTDNVGVTGYHVIRNGGIVAIVSGSQLAYSDSTVVPGNTYSYSVRAYDMAGNYSSQGNTMFVTVPEAPVSMTCPGPALDSFTGCYFGNTSLSGSPLAVRKDNMVNLPWWPYTVPPALTAGNLSAKWEGMFSFQAGLYKFVAVTAGGMRVSIDGKRILDSWNNQSGSTYEFQASLTTGRHLIRVDYFNAAEPVRAALFWTASR